MPTVIKYSVATFFLKFMIQASALQL